MNFLFESFGGTAENSKFHLQQMISISSCASRLFVLTAWHLVLKFAFIARYVGEYPRGLNDIFYWHWVQRIFWV